MTEVAHSVSHPALTVGNKQQEVIVEQLKQDAVEVDELVKAASEMPLEEAVLFVPPWLAKRYADEYGSLPAGVDALVKAASEMPLEEAKRLEAAARWAREVKECAARGEL